MTTNNQGLGSAHLSLTSSEPCVYVQLSKGGWTRIRVATETAQKVENVFARLKNSLGADNQQVAISLRGPGVYVIGGSSPEEKEIQDRRLLGEVEDVRELLRKHFSNSSEGTSISGAVSQAISDEEEMKIFEGSQQAGGGASAGPGGLRHT